LGENSKIEWTDHTFNPWVGCTKVGPGCDHCYAESWAKRTGAAGLWSGERRRTSAANWRKPLKWDREAATSGTRPRVFCASLADVFDNEVPPAWRADLFALIRKTPNLDWLLLTKRIGNASEMMMQSGLLKPLDNVWLGATVVNQLEADRDIPKLLETPARLRFLSMEPLLGPVNIETIDNHGSLYDIAKRGLYWRPLSGSYTDSPTIGWVIVGGESGGGARPMLDTWALEVRHQCLGAGVPFFFKQGSAANWPAYKDPSTFPEALRVREFP
jgi:protein gp37